MDRKHDIDREDLDDDFEATHRDLDAYVRGNQETNAGLERLRWERKIMRVIKSLRDRVEKLEENHHDTAEIAIIAQREVGPARKFVEAIIHWRRRIINYAVGAGVTAFVTWLIAAHGVKKP